MATKITDNYFVVTLAILISEKLPHKRKQTEYSLQMYNIKLIITITFIILILQNLPKKYIVLIIPLTKRLCQAKFVTIHKKFYKCRLNY